MHCYGRNHFSKCIEVAKCFVCADQHKGSEHSYLVDRCGKKATACEHQAAKCANCGGSYIATSRRCPERGQQSQGQRGKISEMLSSPPIQVATRSTNAEMPPMQTSRSTTSSGDMAQVSPRWVRESPDLDSGLESISSTPTPMPTPTPRARARDPTPMIIDDDSDTT
jgi:hypothetical protein